MNTRETLRYLAAGLLREPDRIVHSHDIARIFLKACDEADTIERVAKSNARFMAPILAAKDAPTRLCVSRKPTSKAVK